MTDAFVDLEPKSSWAVGYYLVEEADMTARTPAKLVAFCTDINPLEDMRLDAILEARREFFVEPVLDIYYRASNGEWKGIPCTY